MLTPSRSEDQGDRSTPAERTEGTMRARKDARVLLILMGLNLAVLVVLVVGGPEKHPPGIVLAWKFKGQGAGGCE